MITLTRFDQSELIINADLIEFIEALPDTHITLVTGRKFLVREKPVDVVNRVIEYRRAAGPLLSRPVDPAHLAKVNAGADAAE